MQTGKCLSENCIWKHEIPSEAAQQDRSSTYVGMMVNSIDGREEITLTPSELGHLNEMKTDGAARNMALLDSGSNEVVRTYNGWEWQQIVNKKPHTKKISVTLALNQHMEASITTGGELMRAPPRYGNQMVSKSHWFCPIGRMRTELGLDFMWTARGPIITRGMLSQPI